MEETIERMRLALSIGMLVVMIIGVAVVVPILNQVSRDANISGKPGVGSTVSTLVSVVPVVLAVAVILSVFGFLGSSDGSSSDDEEDDPESPEELPEEHDRSKERLWAEEILKRRYARGEISTEEYNERMANL
jgi:uncharacterized membrane protein